MVDAADPRILDLCRQVKVGDDTGIVSKWNEIKRIGREINQCYRRKVKIPSVGIHRKNRDGGIVTVSTAYKVLDDVCKIGVDLDLLKDATAFEEPDTRVNEQKFIEKCNADARLPSDIAPGSIEVSAVACSHFSVGLHCVLQGKEHTNENITVDGRLSKAKMLQKHPLLTDIFESGLEFDVWKANTDTLYPDLADIAQRALNTKYSAQQGQDAFQMFSRAVNLLNNSPQENAVEYAI